MAFKFNVRELISPPYSHSSSSPAPLPSVVFSVSSVDIIPFNYMNPAKMNWQVAEKCNTQFRSYETVRKMWIYSRTLVPSGFQLLNDNVVNRDQTRFYGTNCSPFTRQWTTPRLGPQEVHRSLSSWQLSRGIQRSTRSSLRQELATLNAFWTFS